ncbi:MAG: hypothetical protein VYE57_10945 [SAR324 cluster bacterium]|nr:hypothetical protein [SAR324 cluster bacterium]
MLQALNSVERNCSMAAVLLHPPRPEQGWNLFPSPVVQRNPVLRVTMSLSSKKENRPILAEVQPSARE